jgi:DNA ligase-associated metallophosphoesterase
MTAAPIHLAGERLMLDPAGTLFWPATSMLVVADLHLEKGSSYARRGSLLPPWDTTVTLDRLSLLLRRWKPSKVVALGDSFHDAEGSGRLPRDEIERLSAITQSVDFVWVQGNHDPTPPEGVGGTWVESFATGPLTFRHEALPRASNEISGHYHPKATIRARAGQVTRACFVTDSRRVLLPAFGAYTGGLDIRDPAIARLFPRGGRAFLLGKDRLFSFQLAGAYRAASATTSRANGNIA